MGVDMTESSSKPKAAKSSTDSGVAGRNMVMVGSAPTQTSRDAGKWTGSLATNCDPRCDPYFLFGASYT